MGAKTNSTLSTRPLEFEVIECQINFLKGKVLTVIDASFPEGQQKKAVKDLVSNAFNNHLDYIESLTIHTGDERFDQLRSGSTPLPRQ